MSRRTPSSRSHTSLLALLLVTVLALVGAGCGSGDGEGDDEPSKSTRTQTTKTDTTTTGEEPGDDPDDERDPTELPEPVPQGELPPIQVTSPTALAYVNDSFVLAGTAQVFEGALQWAILDAKLKPMAQGRMTASCGAPCRGKFRTRIALAKVPVGSWELHVWAPPVADDDPPRVHDTMTPITVTAEPVEGAPDPGATPPGGVPGG